MAPRAAVARGRAAAVAAVRPGCRVASPRGARLRPAYKEKEAVSLVIDTGPTEGYLVLPVRMELNE